MFPLSGLLKYNTYTLRPFVITGAVGVALLISACDIRGDAWKNGPVMVSEVQKQQAEMENEVSRMEKPAEKPEMVEIEKIDAEQIEVDIEEADIKEADSSEIIQPIPEIQRRTLNPKNLFGKNLRSDGERIDRLERAMQDMRNDFDLVEPSIRRLMAIEADIQNLVGELRKLSAETTESRQAMVANNPPPAPQSALGKLRSVREQASKSLQTKTPPPVSGNPEVFDVRVGEHSDKTRIVLDVNAKTTYSIDIDNDEKILVVDLPNTKWSAATSKTLRSKIINSYNVEQAGDGVILVVQLKRSARVANQDDISGAKGIGRRIVIDLK